MAQIFQVLLFFIVLHVLYASSLPLQRGGSYYSHSFGSGDCRKDVEEGTPVRCMAAFPVYKWSHEKQECVKAIYGGCNKTKNNFKTKEECEDTATPICKRGT